MQNTAFHAFNRRRTNSEYKVKGQKMRPKGQPPSSRIVRRPSKLPSATQSSGTTATVRQGSRERSTYRCGCANGDSESPLDNYCGSKRSSPAQKAGGEEAAMPGQPARTHALSVSPGNSPSRITGLPLASPQSSFRRASEGPTFSVHSLCGRSWRVATANRFALVQKLWTMRLPCGRLRKSSENCQRPSVQKKRQDRSRALLKSVLIRANPRLVSSPSLHP